jgi:hypothetical protein
MEASKPLCFLWYCSYYGCCYDTSCGRKEDVEAGWGKRDNLLDGTDPRCLDRSV